MGDRVLVTFRHRTDHLRDRPTYEYSPMIYGHWCGEEMPEIIKAHAHMFRPGDVSYSAARLCAAVCAHHSNTRLSVGIMECPEFFYIGKNILARPDPSDAHGYNNFWCAVSEGDAGVLIVDLNTGDVLTFGGYTKRFKIDLSVED